MKEMTERVGTAQADQGSPPFPESTSGWWSPLVSVGVMGLGGAPRVRLLIRGAELVLASAFVLITMVASPAASPGRATGLIAAGVGVVSWLGWILAGERRAPALAMLGLLSVAGGVCGAVRSEGLLLLFAPVAATCFAFSVPIAVVQGGIGVGAYLVTSAVGGTFLYHPLGLAVALLCGIIMGAGRRQFLERGHKSAALALAQHRADLADQERELVSERNRLGRDIHDVLAHTLGAVAIQLTALDSRVVAEDDAEALRARIHGLHSLVSEGLAEARDAVRALQDARLSLPDQIGRLCARQGVVPVIDGEPRLIDAAVALALHRVVQESLTNAAKHAPGGRLAVTVRFRPESIGVVVDNGPGAGVPGALAASGAGRGLSGMRTRIELLGGVCTAGPVGPGSDSGWRVSATIPVS